jgi:hypothetical protein|tara:strand:- start:275 stop:670 length:396 start_codon:yes stop_codon:yes gene_type:complete
MAEKNQIMLIDIERLFLHWFARVAYCYGISKRAVLNPAALLHNLRGIIFIFSENGCMISSVVAFTGLPGGYRNNNNGNYNNMGNNGYFWSSTENNNNNAWNRKLNYNNSEINRNNNNKKNGFSVRCIRDLV